MNMQSAKKQYEEKLADHFVSCYSPSCLVPRERIKKENLPPRQSSNEKIPDFKYSNAQTGSALVIELTTLTEDDEVLGKIRSTWSFADRMQRQLQLNGTYYCWLAIEDVRDDMLDDMVSSIRNRSMGLKKGESCKPVRPFPHHLTKEDDFGSEICFSLFKSTTSDLDEIKLKQRLLEETREANSKFEGYEGTMRILLIDVTFCIGRNFASFSVWDAPDQQLSMQIEKTCSRVDSVFLCKSTWAWRGKGEPIPIHGYHAGIERGRIAPEEKRGLPQYRETGYWEFSRPIYQRKEIQNL